MPNRDEMKRPENRRWFAIMGVSVLAAIGASLLLGDYLLPDCEHEGCPAVERLRSYRPPEPPQIFDASGELAGQLSGPRRMVVSLDSIPELVREGYIAVEDRRFREHGGVDFAGAVRAFVANFKSGGVEEGASTITMQLARNVFGEEVLDYNRWHRKASEIRTAREIEEQLGKDEILELYLNQIYLGDGVYGVETAARNYFQKPVADVTVAEAAVLIGLAKNPEGYNPRRNPERARERRDLVLDILERDGLVTPEQAAEARAEGIEVAEDRETGDWGASAYYLNGVRRELREMYPDPADRRGLRVYTGLDSRAQAAAVEALVEQIRSIEAGRWGRFRHEAAPAGSLGPAGGDSPYLQGMVVAMDVQTGLVTTLVGGRDYDHSEFDRAFLAERQPGSAFKPIVYVTALAQGLRPSEAIATDPIRLARQGSEDWEPTDHVSGRALTVRDALVHSSNTAAVRVGQRAGTERVIRQAHAMGIGGDLPNVPSIFLGAGEVVPAELVAAFAAFGNGGHTIDPHFVTRIEDGRGRVVYQRDASPGERAVDGRLAFLVLDMMRDVVRRGTGTRAGGIGVPVAGKTGTTNESKDAWFVGLTPRLVAGVWLGFDRPAPIVSGAGGGQLAAPVWSRFMRVASRDHGDAREWSPPPGVVQATVDSETGYRWGAACTGEPRTEYFLAGTEPRSECPSWGPGWFLGEDGQWEFRGYTDTLGYGSLDGSDSARAWPDGRDRERTRFYDDTILGSDEFEARRRAQLDSMDAEWRRRSRPAPAPRDTVRIPSGRDAGPGDARGRIRPADTTRAAPVPTPEPAPLPAPPPADSAGGAAGTGG